MNWKTILLVNLAMWVTVLSTEENCWINIWTTRGKVVRFGDEVFCSRICSTQMEGKLIITAGPEGRQLETLSIDDATVKTRVKFTEEKIRYVVCEFNGYYRQLYYIKVVPLLQVRDFKCRTYSADLVMCTFSRVGRWQFRHFKYFLITDKGRVSCSYNPSKVQCMDFSVNLDMKSQHFKIEMEYFGDIQTQEFIITIDQDISQIGTIKPYVSTTHKITCVHILDSTATFVGQDWQVKMLPRNPRIQMQVRHRATKNNQLPVIYVCFGKLYAFQKYAFLISRRSWQRNISQPKEYFLNYLTPAARPVRPPQFLSNGFFHDPDKRELYVYWMQLDELERNGPNFTYNANSDNGLNVALVSNTSAVFRNWDATKPGFIQVWSENSEGSSGSNQLELPILTDAWMRQPRNLWFNDENRTLSWQPPIEWDELLGYTVYWCIASRNRSQICDDQEPFHLHSLGKLQQQFQINETSKVICISVLARYSDGISGGMRWKGPLWIENSLKKVALHDWSLYVVPIAVLTGFALIFSCYRKLKKMADIQVTLPEFQLTSMEPKDTNNSKTNEPASIAVPGNFSPKAVLNIEMLPVENSMDEEQPSEPSPYKTMDIANSKVSCAYTSTHF